MELLYQVLKLIVKFHPLVFIINCPTLMKTVSYFLNKRANFNESYSTNELFGNLIN